MLASQSDWNNKLGFYLDLEATTASDGSCHPEGVTLYLGVADGTGWRFPSLRQAWQYGHTYKVVATIAPAYAELQVDGVTVAHSPGGFAPFVSPVTMNQIPDWAASPTTYLAVQGDLTISNSAGSVTAHAAGTELPSEVILLTGGTLSGSIQFTSSATDTQVIATPVTFHQMNTAEPLIDRWGQSIQSPWSGKVKSDADLAAADATEQSWLDALPPACGYDAWGGSVIAGWRQTPTGSYTIAKRKGYWWLITPDGNPVFYTGVGDAPALTWDMTPLTGRTAMFADLPDRTDPSYAAAWGHNVWGDSGSVDYFAFITSNLVRKFGGDWRERETALTERRIRGWAFSGLGKWATEVGDLPLLPVLYSSTPTLVTHIDPFDASIQAQFRADIQSQVAGRANAKRILGWSYQNEIQGIVMAAETQQILGMSSGVPAKRALLDYAVNTLYAGSVSKLAASWQITAGTLDALYSTSPSPPANDLESLREYYENELHKFIYNTFKQADPNHLYFGFWIVPGWWADPSDWRIAAANCDVLGYDRYAFSLLTPDLVALLSQLDKPSLIGEFSFPPTYGMERGFAAYPWANAEGDAASGEAYKRWVLDAAREPSTVGVMWFQYRDEPLSGRGPGSGPLPVYGEHYAFGLTDTTDRPKYDLVSRMREANLASGNRRLALTDPPPHGRIRPLVLRPTTCVVNRLE